MADSIEAGIGGGQGPIGRVRIAPLIAFIASARPRDAGFLRGFGVCLANPYAFHATDLLKSQGWVELLGETQLVEAAHYLHAEALMRPHSRLMQEIGRAARLSHSRSVKPDSFLTTPSHEAAMVGEYRDGCMSDGDTRP